MITLIPKQKKRLSIKNVIVVIVVIAVIASLILLYLMLENSARNASAYEKTLLASISDSISIPTEEPAVFEEKNTEADTEIYTEDTEGEDEVYATSHEQEPVTQDIVRISDMYAVKGDLTLKSYYPDATQYTWELYNTEAKCWDVLDARTACDELYRQVSVVSLNLSEDIMIRCSIERDGADEKILDIASVKCIKSIVNVTATDEKFKTGSGHWLSSRDIPVKVTYHDNSSEILKGLYGLVFVDKLESSEITYSDTGNVIETVTTINTECEYSYIDTGEKEFVIRYRDQDKSYDTKLTVVSADIDPPVISAVSLSDFTIKTVDEPVTVEVTISAEDNETPYPALEYAFLPQGVDPEDTDWIAKPKFEKDIDQNGIWVAYCRDRKKNIAMFEEKIIVVDQKGPELALTLKNTNWCAANKIIANAKDELPVTYLFTCRETGENSGWTDKNEYDVTQNGTWEVQARDEVGNITVMDIAVSNIDAQMPIIKGITEGEQIYEN